MATVVQENTAPMTERNTGFPEPFNPDRNTTLPHPDADRSKNPTIEAPDVPLHRSHSRSRSFLGRHHSHGQKQQKGTLKIEDSGLYDNIEYADGTKEYAASQDLHQEAHKGVDGADGSTDSDVTDKSPEERDEQGYKQGERKKGVLRKLNLHKA